MLCSSYSGDTEETLACFAAAEALGARRIVASTGGALVEAARAAGVPVIGLPGLLPAPRTAVAYMLVCAAEVAALAGAAPRIHTEIDAAAAFLEERSGGLQTRAEEIAAASRARTPVITGAELTAPVARRWKTQINENAKLPAFFSELPEADHNELCGWSGGWRLLGRAARGLRPAPARAAPLRADRGGDRRAGAEAVRSRPRARPASPACSGRRCSATWSRSPWPRRAVSTRSRSRRSRGFKVALGRL